MWINIHKNGKKLFLVFLILVGVGSLQSQQNIQFRISKPYCLFNFLETMKGSTAVSEALRQYADSHAVVKTQAFRAIINQYKTVQLYYTIRYDEFPAGRGQEGSTFDLVSSAAVHSNNIDDFRERIQGVLPNTEVQKLVTALKLVEPYYDTLIWNKQYTELQHQVQVLQQKIQLKPSIFANIKTFYGSAWANDFPFIISPYPVPGKKGSTSASPHGNCLCIGVLTSDTDYTGIAGVGFHEMSHILYKEQPAELQHDIDRYFRTSTSPYKELAYNYFNEALATACGNGWAYKQLEGKMDTAEWYHNRYIDGLAHAIYPTVESYINANKGIDSNFVSTTIKLFEKTFPNSYANYETLLAGCIYYYDLRDEKHAQQDEVIKRYFNVHLTHGSSPILHPYSIEELQTSNQPQFILIDSNREITFKKLRKVFPELNGLLKDRPYTDFYVSFFDKRNRPIIIVSYSSLDSLDLIMKDMKYSQGINAGKPYHKL